MLVASIRVPEFNASPPPPLSIPFLASSIPLSFVFFSNSKRMCERMKAKEQELPSNGSFTTAEAGLGRNREHGTQSRSPPYGIRPSPAAP